MQRVGCSSRRSLNESPGRRALCPQEWLECQSHHHTLLSLHPASTHTQKAKCLNDCQADKYVFFLVFLYMDVLSPTHTQVHVCIYLGENRRRRNIKAFFVFDEEREREGHTPVGMWRRPMLTFEWCRCCRLVGVAC